MKTVEIYIYNRLKNLQIYNFLHPISTFYRIISTKILHLQTPLLSTILQYFCSVFLHSTLIFLAKSTIYKTTNPPPILRSRINLRTLMFLLEITIKTTKNRQMAYFISNKFVPTTPQQISQYFIK